MASPVDPNEPLMTGENSFIRLSPDGGTTMTDRFSHWRVLWCAAGAGHVLFTNRRDLTRTAGTGHVHLVQSKQLTSGRVQLYSDNAADARWLQRSIETTLFPPSPAESLPVIAAAFARAGPPRAAAWETVI